MISYYRAAYLARFESDSCEQEPLRQDAVSGDVYVGSLRAPHCFLAAASLPHLFIGALLDQDTVQMRSALTPVGGFGALFHAPIPQSWAWWTSVAGAKIAAREAVSLERLVKVAYLPRSRDSQSKSASYLHWLTSRAACVVGL